jgi:hypothetical protein
MAMRALQDRIQVLETDKAAVVSQLKAAEERYREERHRWQSRVEEEESQACFKERVVLSRYAEAEAVNARLNETTFVQQEQLKILGVQVKILQSENRRLVETYDIDRGNWAFELEQAQNDLRLMREAEKRLISEVKGLQSQGIETKRELKEARKDCDRLTSEATVIRLTAEQQRNTQAQHFEHSEARSNKQSQDQANRIKQLELQVRRLNAQVKTAEKAADYWKKEEADKSRATVSLQDKRFRA